MQKFAVFLLLLLSVLGLSACKTVYGNASHAVRYGGFT